MRPPLLCCCLCSLPLGSWGNPVVVATLPYNGANRTVGTLTVGCMPHTSPYRHQQRAAARVMPARPAPGAVTPAFCAAQQSGKVCRTGRRFGNLLSVSMPSAAAAAAPPRPTPPRGMSRTAKGAQRSRSASPSTQGVLSSFPDDVSPTPYTATVYRQVPRKFRTSTASCAGPHACRLPASASVLPGVATSCIAA